MLTHDMTAKPAVTPPPAPPEGRAMRAIYEAVERAATTDATVLVWGESGVGKERVASRVHQLSLRARGPLVKVNCAALPADLLESELFGYERGAFTGAHQSKPGKFELAHTGTIMLDEIGELPLPLQAKLLAVLQDRQFARLGGRCDVHTDVRVIALTNRNLAQLVQLGQFREDLYYRLNVVAVHVPPLRERRDEIPGLVEYFLDVYARHYDRPKPTLPPAVFDRIHRHAWPGNVREIENFMKRIVVLGVDEAVLDDIGAPPAAHAPEGARAPAPRGDEGDHLTDDEPGLKDVVQRAAREAERVMLERTLQMVRWHRGDAARKLKISYTALLYKMKQHGLGC